MYNIVSLAVNIFDVIVTFMLFGDFLEWKSDRRIVHTAGGILMFILTLISNSFIKNPIWQGIVTLMMFFILMLFFRDRAEKKILVIVGYMAIVIVADVMVSLLLSGCFNLSSSTFLDNDSGYRIAGMIISKPIVLFLIKMVSLFKNKRDIQLYKNYWIALLTIPIVNIALLMSILNLFFYYEMSDAQIGVFYVATICILYNNILVFYLFDRIINKAVLKKTCTMLENQIVMQTNQTHRDNDKEKRYESIKHDIKNHFQMLYVLCMEKRYNDLMMYLKDTGLVCEVNNKMINTGILSLDSILNGKASEADKYGVRTSIQCKVPNDLNIAPMDICVLFGNLIDNAIEGCINSGCDKKELKIYIEYVNQRLIICVQNSANNSNIKKKDDEIGFVSTKADKEGHGIGIYNINEIVQKYGGICKMVPEEELFTVYITLFDIW